MWKILRRTFYSVTFSLWLLPSPNLVDASPSPAPLFERRVLDTSCWNEVGDAHNLRDHDNFISMDAYIT